MRYEDRDGDFPWPIIIGIALWLAAEPAVAPTNNPQADKQAVDEMRQRHDDQVIGAVRVALSAPNQTVSTAVSVVTGIRSGNNKGNNTTNKTEGDEPVVITISKDKYPETAKHVEEATAKGHPNTGKIDRAGAANRRKDSLKNVPKEKGKDRDEFPPAVLDVGGKGASIKHVNSSDNRGAGSSMGNQMKKLPDGTKVKIIVKDGMSATGIISYSLCPRYHVYFCASIS